MSYQVIIYFGVNLKQKIGHLHHLKQFQGKRNLISTKNQSKNPIFFKQIYLQWIREQVTNIKEYVPLNKNTDNTDTAAPVYKSRVPFRNSLTWLHYGKRHFQLVIACKLDLKAITLGSLIIKTKKT